MHTGHHCALGSRHYQAPLGNSTEYQAHWTVGTIGNHCAVGTTRHHTSLPGTRHQKIVGITRQKAAADTIKYQQEVGTTGQCAQGIPAEH